MTRRRRAPELTPEGRLPAHEYTEARLRTFLVEDAVRAHATYLPWAVAAYDRIGKLSGRGPEAAFLEVVAEVEALTGHAEMPMAAITAEEMRRLLA